MRELRRDELREHAGPGAEVEYLEGLVRLERNQSRGDAIQFIEAGHHLTAAAIVNERVIVERVADSLMRIRHRARIASRVRF